MDTASLFLYGRGGLRVPEVVRLTASVQPYRAVHALRGEVEQIGERQDFTEKLLEGPKSED